MINTPKRREPSRWVLPLLLLMAVGTGIGLIISWVVWPVEYVDVAPDSLQPSHRKEYLVLIGSSYAYNRDLGLAQSRLATLGDSMGSEVVTLAEEYASVGGNARQIRALTALAYALGFRRAALAPYMPDLMPTATWTPWPMPTPTFTPSPTATMTPLPTLAVTMSLVPTKSLTVVPSETVSSTIVPTVTGSLSPTLTTTPTKTRTASVPTETPAPTMTPVLTETPWPTPTPTVTPVPAPRFEIVEQRRMCDPPGGQLRVIVGDNAGRPQPNVELLVRWDGQDEHFFTGLKPEQSIGYADFTMQKEQLYELVIVGVESDVAQGLVADECEDERRLASWNIVFQFNQP